MTDVTALTTTLSELWLTKQNLTLKNNVQETELPWLLTESAFPCSVWVWSPMFTRGNYVWIPHRGCRNLVLPYRIYRDSKNTDSKSFRVLAAPTADVPDDGTSVDNPFEEARFIDIGTNVDTGITEYILTDRSGTGVDLYFDHTAVNNAKCVNTCDDRSLDTYTDSLTGTSRSESSCEASVLDNETDRAVSNKTGQNIDTDAPVREAGFSIDTVRGITDTASDVTNTNTVMAEDSNVSDTEEEINNEVNIAESNIAGRTETDLPNDGTINACGDRGTGNDKASNSSTYLAFWNSNNCNTVSSRDARYYFEYSSEGYTECFEARECLRTTRSFPPAECEHLFYENPGEYIVVQGSHGYGRIEKNPNWSPAHSRKPEWWAKCVSWSCRLCVVGMLVVLGYCLYGKIKDKIQSE